MDKCPYCRQPIESFKVLNEEIIDDTAIITVRYTCHHCQKDFIGTIKGEIKFWQFEEIEECDYYLG